MSLRAKTHQCGAFAQTTRAQCRRRALPGASYCLVHVGKTSLLISAFVGALFGLALSEGWRAFVPSSELQALRNLKADIQPILELARENNPGATDKQAVRKLTQDVERLRDQASRVRSFELAIEIVVFGQWAAGAPPTSPGILKSAGTPDAILHVETPGGHVKHVSLYTGSLATITASGIDQATIKYKAATPPGTWPIGEPSSDLSMLVGGELILFGVRSDSFTDRQYGIRSFKLQAFINGVERLSFTLFGKGELIGIPPDNSGVLHQPFQYRASFKDAT